MPIKLNEDHMNHVYKAVSEGQKVKDISFALNITVYQVERLYNAARRRTWAHYQCRMLQAKVRRKVFVHKAAAKPTTYQRAPAQYSNQRTGLGDGLEFEKLSLGTDAE